MTAMDRARGIEPELAEREASGTPRERTGSPGGSIRGSCDAIASWGQNPSFPVSDYAPKSDMAGRCVDGLGVPRGGPVAATIVRRAKMRAALDDLARDSDIRLAWIVA